MTVRRDSTEDAGREAGSEDAFTDTDRLEFRAMLRGAFEALREKSKANVAQTVELTPSLVDQLGLNTIGSGGASGGLREAVILFEEAGRSAIVRSGLLGVVLLNLLQRRWSGRLIVDPRSSEVRIACLFGAYDGDVGAGRVSWCNQQVTGNVNFVEGAAEASHLLAFVNDPPGLAVIPAGHPGITIRATPGLGVAALSNVNLSGVPGHFVPVDAAAIEDIVRVARLCLAACALGSADRALELAVDHAKTRRQFGRIIGCFQAIQHKLVNCLVAVDGSRLTIDAAAAAFDNGSGDWRRVAATAVAFAGSNLRQVILEAHHTLGAIGYAEEHELPRHFRSIHSDLTRLGGAPRARRELAMTLLETASRLRPPELGPDEVRLRAIRQGGNSVEAFRAEIREWLADHWGEERAIRHRRLAERDRGWDPEFSRELGAKGWIGLGWPKAYGGQERSPADQMVFVEELAYAEAPLQVHQMAEMVVGPALIAHGTPEQRAEYLPCILRGEFSCALGYSESEAGSDLASLRTRAERVGEKWIIEGEKMWATNADKASHIWLAARTDRSAEPPHAGISVFLLPLDTPGIQIRPSMSMYGKTFSTTTYQDVAVPETAMVGPVNGGWRVITSALAAERMLIGRLVGVLQRVFDKILDHFRAAESGPQHLGHQADTLAKIGGLAADIEAARQFVFRNALLLQSGRIPVHEAAMTKMFAGELQERLGEGGLDLLGSAGLLSEEPGAPVAELEHLLRHSIMGVIGGGTSEIQRNIIATRGLGLPR